VSFEALRSPGDWDWSDTHSQSCCRSLNKEISTWTVEIVEFHGHWIDVFRRRFGTRSTIFASSRRRVSIFLGTIWSVSSLLPSLLSPLPFYFLSFEVSLVFIRMKLRVFVSADEILFRAPTAATISAPYAERGSALCQRNYTNTSFFDFVRMFARFTALGWIYLYIFVANDLPICVSFNIMKLVSILSAFLATSRVRVGSGHGVWVGLWGLLSLRSASFDLSKVTICLH